MQLFDLEAAALKRVMNLVVQDHPKKEWSLEGSENPIWGELQLN